MVFLYSPKIGSDSAGWGECNSIDTVLNTALYRLKQFNRKLDHLKKAFKINSRIVMPLKRLLEVLMQFPFKWVRR